MAFSVLAPDYAKPERVVAEVEIFTPTDLSGSHWYTGEDAVEIGGALDAWVSRVPLGGISEPVLITNMLAVDYGGGRYVEADGSTSYVTANALGALAATGPILFAATVEFVLTPSGDHTVMGVSASGNAFNIVSWGIKSGDDDRIWLHRVDGEGSESEWYLENPEIEEGDRYTVIVYHDGTDFFAWLDGIPFYRNGDMENDGGISPDLFTMMALVSNGGTSEYTAVRIFDAVIATPSSFTVEDMQVLNNSLNGFDPMNDVTVPVSNERRVHLIIGGRNAAGQGDETQAVEFDVPLMSLLEVGEYQSGPMAMREAGVHGPEFGIANECQELELAVGVLKRAMLSSPLADKSGTPLCWLPSSEEHFTRTNNWVQVSALPVLETYGWAEALDGVLVWLGEDDAEIEADAQAFDMNMIAVSDALRAAYSDTSLKVVSVMLHKDSPKAFADDLRTSLNNWAADDDNNLLIVTHDIELDVGLVDYTSDGNLKVGERHIQATEYPGVIEWHGSAQYDSAAGTWGAYRAASGRSTAIFTEATNKPGDTNINGIPCLSFDGTNDIMAYNGLAALYSDPVGGDFRFGLSMVVSILDTTAGDVLWAFGGAGTQEFSLSINASQQLEFTWTNDATNSSTYTTSYTISDTDPHLISIDKYFNGRFIVYVDNVEVLDTVADAGAITLTTFAIGAAVGGGNHSELALGHLSFDAARAESKRLADETRLTEWWRLSVTAGAGIFDSTFDATFN